EETPPGRLIRGMQRLKAGFSASRNGSRRLARTKLQRSASSSGIRGARGLHCAECLFAVLTPPRLASPSPRVVRAWVRA
ncbi:MAG: hypothetical protein ABI311_03060, partial [Gemmatimonadaceae bacterium]